jgi:hypothetical protein
MLILRSVLTYIFKCIVSPNNLCYTCSNSRLISSHPLWKIVSIIIRSNLEIRGIHKDIVIKKGLAAALTLSKGKIDRREDGPRPSNII